MKILEKVQGKQSTMKMLEKVQGKQSTMKMLEKVQGKQSTMKMLEKALSPTGSALARTDLSPLTNGIWEIHAGCSCFLHLQLLAKISYIP